MKIKAGVENTVTPSLRNESFYDVEYFIGAPISIKHRYRQMPLLMCSADYSNPVQIEQTGTITGLFIDTSIFLYIYKFKDIQ